MVLLDVGCGEKYMRKLLEVPTPLGYEKSGSSLSYKTEIDYLTPYSKKKYELTY